MVIEALKEKNGRQYIVKEMEEVEEEGSEWFGKFKGVAFILECNECNIKNAPKLKSQYLLMVSYRSKELLPVSVGTIYYEYHEGGRDVVWDISFRKNQKNKALFLKYKYLSSDPKGYSEKEVEIFHF